MKHTATVKASITAS